jgi:hypothetical protein
LRLRSEADVAILVPEYDGDIVNLDGYNLFSVLNDKSNGRHSVTLLRAANHNYFNRIIQRNDATMMRSEEELKNQLTREAQEEFLKNFAVDFLTASLHGSKENRIYDMTLSQPNKLYGQNVKILYRDSLSKPLIEIKKQDTILTKGATSEYVEDSWFYKLDQVLIDTITIGDGPYQIRPLLRVSWKNPEDQVSFIPLIRDFSKNQALMIELVVDSADEANLETPYQRFTVRLTDVLGSTSDMILPDQLNALTRIPGELQSTQIFEETSSYWSKNTPIGSLVLPLKDFKNIDLTQITSIDLIFDQTEKGSVYIHKIMLQ